MTNKTRQLPDYVRLLNVHGHPTTAREDGSYQPPQIATHWNPRDKCSLLELQKQNQRVAYQGSGKSDSDAASVRANCAAVPAHGIHYWELQVLDRGRDGYIGVGYSTSSVNTARLPGWELGSYGYHGTPLPPVCRAHPTCRRRRKLV